MWKQLQGENPSTNSSRAYTNLPVTAVDRGVHAALCILDQVLWAREMACQTCNVTKHERLSQEDHRQDPMAETESGKAAYRAHML